MSHQWCVDARGGSQGEPGGGRGTSRSRPEHARGAMAEGGPDDPARPYPAWLSLRTCSSPQVGEAELNSDSTA
ncbi:hypothetical protein JCM9957A_26900 [Kineosporia succinea]